MSQRPTLRTEARAGLVLSPAAQLSLKVLQASTLELEEIVEQELLVNPVLELEYDNGIDDEPGADGEHDAADMGERDDRGERDDFEERDGRGERVDFEERDDRGERDGREDGADRDDLQDRADLQDHEDRHDRDDRADREDRHDRGEERADLDDRADLREKESDLPDWPSLLDDDFDSDGEGVREEREAAEAFALDPAIAESLGESLRSQLRLLTLEKTVRAAAEYLIGCLDDRGYLVVTTAEVARDLDLPAEIVERAIETVQGLEPPGVAARDLMECLLVQLRARGRAESLAYRIVAGHFPRLAGRRYSEIARSLRAQPPEMEAALEEIRRLCPYPGRLVGGAEVRYIYPDLIVEKVGEGWEVYPNDRTVPRLRISRSCRRLLEGHGGDEHALDYARSRLRSARWLLQALDRRRSTMLQVMRCIVAEQEEFLERGVAYLRPLTLQVVAGRLGIHESTVARVTRSKYAQTPRGILPLKFFFSGRLPRSGGDDVSNRTVKERVRVLIEQEDRRHPLSDDAIAGALGREGFRIARRTVAKYRESLRIERAQLRRRVRSGGSSPGSCPKLASGDA